MYRQLDDFFRNYEFLVEGTGKVLDRIHDENLGQAVAPGHRTLGQIAWHIVVSVPEMMNRTGLSMAAGDWEAPPPAAARKIAAAYRETAGALVAAIRKKWTDATLQETDDMYGVPWPRGFTLQALVQHEIHHRGQMTVLMRQAGLPVPGLFGPAKEEWAQFGMEAPSY
jgi:uncharacterized damage-inducible protein DinB